MLVIEWVICILIFMLGTSLGSFLNAYEYRLANNQKITGRSNCPICRHTIAWYDNVPIISYILLRAKCRHCGKHISLQYPLVELWMGCAFVVILYATNLLSLPSDLSFVSGVLNYTAYAIIIWSLTFVFIYDLKYTLVSDRVVIVAVAIIYTLFSILGVHGLFDMLLGAGIGGGFFLAQYVVSKGTWVGGGDVRIGILMGVILGWKQVLLALWIAYVLGAIIGVGLVVLKKKKLRSEVPFGIFLSVATIVTLIWGELAIQWYLGLL